VSPASHGTRPSSSAIAAGVDASDVATVRSTGHGER